MPDFQNIPGYYFVVATLVPLVSFLLIFLARGLWGAIRPYREQTWAEGLYKTLGGDEGGKTGAYVATAAIAISFVLCLVGFITYVTTSGHDEEQVHALEAKIADYRQQIAKADEADREDLRSKLELEEANLHGIEQKWSGSWTWLSVAPSTLADDDHGTALKIGFYIDGLSAVMFLMVTFVATLIHLFSIGYMSEELGEKVEDHHVHTDHGHLVRRGRFGRFFMYLSLFCFSMLNLLLADNLFQIFVSWELVGICSFLLIGFYFERQSASNAANKAFITNRVGDAGFIIGLLIVFTYFGTFNFQDIFQRVRAPETDTQGQVALAGHIVRVDPGETEGDAGAKARLVGDGSHALIFPRVPADDYVGVKPGETVEVHDTPKPDQHGTIPYWLLVVAGLGIFLGCVGKSAQFPLQVWLPDAMEGPTPVSALIHAATMVAAGVYLVGRAYPLFTPDVLLVIAYVGAITLFVAATIAIVMTDIKKVLAYSTVSQLGYMMLALGVGGWVAGLFHLITHAFFKALLFLGSGSVIYGCHHEQEMTKMGGLYSKMKITSLTMLMGVLAIAGIPLFTGWYSKDAIVANAFGYVWHHPQHLLLFVLPLVTAGITAFYMFRMWLMTFTGEPRDEHVHEHAHESPWTMTVPLVLLAILSVGAAWGWPVWDATASSLGKHLEHAQPGHLPTPHHGGHEGNAEGEHPEEEPILAVGEGETQAVIQAEFAKEHQAAHDAHLFAGNLALGAGLIGIVFAFLIYYFRALDPEEAKEQFPRAHSFLMNKWRFDELYSVLLVRPTLVIGHWCKAFDLNVLDGFLHRVASGTVRLAKWDGAFDNGVIDGLVLLVGRVVYRVGGSLRNVQTGFLRSYVLFLVLAAVGIFVLLSYFVLVATAG